MLPTIPIGTELDVLELGIRVYFYIVCDITAYRPPRTSSDRWVCADTWCGKNASPSYPPDDHSLTPFTRTPSLSDGPGCATTRSPSAGPPVTSARNGPR
jgi:hypothetical protein